MPQGGFGPVAPVGPLNTLVEGALLGTSGHRVPKRAVVALWWIGLVLGSTTTPRGKRKKDLIGGAAGLRAA